MILSKLQMSTRAHLQTPDGQKPSGEKCVHISLVLLRSLNNQNISHRIYILWLKMYLK